jgi:hypothetical protein
MRTKVKKQTAVADWRRDGTRSKTKQGRRQGLVVATSAGANAATGYPADTS